MGVDYEETFPFFPRPMGKTQPSMGQKFLHFEHNQRRIRIKKFHGWFAKGLTTNYALIENLHRNGLSPYTLWGLLRIRILLRR